MFTFLLLDLSSGLAVAIQRGLSPPPRWSAAVDATLELTHERVDDVPLLLGFLIKLKLPEILDRHYPAHPLHQGLSNGWLDTGYFSAAAGAALEDQGFDPYIATERQGHHAATTTGPASAAKPATSPATAKERMRAKLDTEPGRALYARRKTIVEPVFGQIKEARGFRRFLLRGLGQIRGE